MSSLTMLVDAAENSKTDLLITFQSPTLYAAIRRAPTVNKMFTLLQNPFILGAGDSDTNHLEHLTGMYLIPPYNELLNLVAECRPAITRLGVIYDSGNDDSVFRKDDLIRVAAEHQMEVIAVAYTAQMKFLPPRMPSWPKSRKPSFTCRIPRRTSPFGPVQKRLTPENSRFLGGLQHGKNRRGNRLLHRPR
jgi:ABC-type uncharacterized transport system substrate-binding protein